MGYSTTAVSELVAEAMIDLLRHRENPQDDSSNTWRHGGHFYFYEETRQDQPDGGIRGEVWGDDPQHPGHVKRTGTVSIDGHGNIRRWPTTTKSERLRAQTVGFAEYLNIYGERFVTTLS